MVTFYGSSLLTGSVPAGEPLDIRGAGKPGLVTKNGLVLFGNDGKAVSIRSQFLVFLFLTSVSREGLPLALTGSWEAHGACLTSLEMRIKYGLCLSACWLGKDGPLHCASVSLSIKHEEIHIRLPLSVIKEIQRGPCGLRPTVHCCHLRRPVPP